MTDYIFLHAVFRTNSMLSNERLKKLRAESEEESVLMDTPCVVCGEWRKLKMLSLDTRARKRK